MQVLGQNESTRLGFPLNSFVFLDEECDLMKLFKKTKKSQQNIPSFRRLTWKFTVSLTLTIILAFILLELIVITLLYGIFLLEINNTLKSVPQALTELNPKFIPLMTKPPKLARLEEVLLSIEELRSSEKPNFSVPLPRTKEAIAIVNSKGNVLATSNTKQISQGTHLLNSLLIEEASILKRALAGEQNSIPFSASPFASLAAASPIVNKNHDILGASLFYKAGVNEEDFYGSGLVLALISIFVLLFFAIPIGTLLGAGRARRLINYLEKLKTVTSTWSQGDFSTLLTDSHGELGVLTKQLNAMAKELQTLFQARQQLAILEERQRIARELHDSVKQQVFATALQVGAARLQLNNDPVAVEKNLIEAESLAVQARAELTNLIKALKPAGLEEKTFIAALHELAQSWTLQQGIKLETDLDELALTTDVEQVLYRVAQEAFANIAKHSKAKQVNFSLKLDKSVIAMKIADDGQGFAPELVEKKGMGIYFMQERLKVIGGWLKLKSQPEGNTQVIAYVPYQEQGYL